MNKKGFVSVVIPCLNEEKGIIKCIKQIINTFNKSQKTNSKFPGKNFFEIQRGRQINPKFQKIKHQTFCEIIVVDNGSTDGSVEVVEREIQKTQKTRNLGKPEGRKVGELEKNIVEIRLVREKRKGYGFALRRGFEEANGEIIVMGDGDGSYDFAEMPKLVEKLLEGYDLVLGSRLAGRIQKGAMPFLHRFIGTPILNFLFNLFFKIKFSDTQSGFRAFRKNTVGNLSFKTGGMEFASEMLVLSQREGMKMTEVPVYYFSRIGKSKLSPLRDAWRHIKFLLLFSPSYLFMLPGAFIFIIGITMVFLLSFGPLKMFGRFLDVHTMLVFSFVTVLGFQIIFLGFFAKTLAFIFLEERDFIFLRFLKILSLERGLLIGGLFTIYGIIIFGKVFFIWASGGFGELAQVRLLILSMTILILGVQGFFSSFFFALIGREDKKG